MAMQKKGMMFLGAMALVFSAHTVAADKDPNLGLIKARQGDMELRAYSAGPLFAIAKGKMPYDAEKASKLANNLMLLLQLDVGGAWAPGTGKDMYPGKTHAVPEVWSTYPKIAEAGKKYKAAVEDLAAVAGNGLGDLKSKIGAVGKSCKGCHDDFREKE
jgi:cytochrome c556